MNKKGIALILTLCMLLFSGCSLAKEPEDRPKQSRLMGVYLVDEAGERELQESENWVESGTLNMDTEFGKLDVPRMVFPAVCDPEMSEITFPGVKGYALFSAVIRGENGDCNVSVSDLEHGHFGVHVNDFGTSYDLSGTLYVGKQSADKIWTVYHVYQSADGTVYLDGKGNSHQGSTFSTKLEENQTVTVDGEEGTLYTKVEVKLEEIPQIEKLLVHQYNAAGERIETNTLSLTTQPETVSWNPDAAWAVVEEHSDDGVKRTAYDRTQEEQITHTAYILNSEQVGEGKIITFGEPEK